MIEIHTDGHKNGGDNKRRDYRAMFRAAFTFIEAHTPQVDRAYWRSHDPDVDECPQSELAYWTRTAQDVSAASCSFAGDPFFADLLAAVYAQLEREFLAARQAAAQEAPSSR